MKKRAQVIAAAALMSLGSTVFADTVTVDFGSTQSLKGLGSFTGTAVYNDSTDQLTLDIANTSRAGGLTAFAFDVPKGDAAQFERAKGLPWKDERNHKGYINAKPYGKYEAGAAVHGNWGAGAGKLGIAAGDSETFVFNVSGADASSLTAADFFDSTTPEIVASFAGFRHHKTDRASGFGSPVVTTTSNDPPTIHPNDQNNDGDTTTITTTAVPLPSSAPAGLGLLGLLALARFAARLRGKLA